jgi:predicted DNA-binding transcriptional regulator AlpA
MYDDLMRTIEARALLKVSRAKWARLRRSPGFVRPIKLGARSFRWKRCELLSYLETRREPECPSEKV